MDFVNKFYPVIPQILFSNATAFQSDCDCACAMESTESLPPPQINGRWMISPLAQEMFLFSESQTNWHSIFLPNGATPLVVLNSPAWELWQRFHTPMPLDLVMSPVTSDILSKFVETGIIISERSGPIAPSVSSSQKLTVWLHTTNACNLNCDYCYLSKDKASMSETIGKRSIDKVFDIAEKYNYKTVKLKYAGGEPLLNFDFILQLHSFARNLASSHNIKLESVLLSNGVSLTKSQVKKLIENKIEIMISLDGIGKWHDIQRHFGHQRETSTKVIDSIKLCLDFGLVPFISVTISNRNIDGLPETVRYLLENGLPFNLNFYRETAQTSKHKDLEINSHRLIEVLLKTLSIIEDNFPNFSLLGSIIDRSSFVAPHSYSCSVGRDYLVIDQFGRIAKCQMELDKLITDIYDEDPLLTLRNDKIGVQNPPVDDRLACRTCEWRYWCGGGCPLLARHSTGDYSGKSPYCDVYKTIYPELIRLETLRLIKVT